MEPIRQRLQQVRDAGGSANDGEPLSVQFALEKEDLIGFTVHAQTKSPWKAVHRRRRKSSFGINLVIWIIIGISIAGLINIFGRPGSPSVSNSWSFVIGAFTALILMAIFMVLARGRLARQSMTRYLNDGTFESTLAPQQVDLDSDGVRCTSDLRQVMYRWPAIHKVLRLPDVTYLYISSLQAVIIPRRAFVVESDFSRFGEQAEQFWKAARG